MNTIIGLKFLLEEKNDRIEQTIDFVAFVILLRFSVSLLALAYSMVAFEFQRIHHKRCTLAKEKRRSATFTDLISICLIFVILAIFLSLFYSTDNSYVYESYC